MTLHLFGFTAAPTGHCCLMNRTRLHAAGKMLVRCYRAKLSVCAALCVLVLCWFYIFPVYRLPSEKEMVDEVLRQGDVWQKNQTGIDLYRFVSLLVYLRLMRESWQQMPMFAK